MSDIYDEAVAYLTAQPNMINTAWNYPNDEPGGALFRYVSPSGECDIWTPGVPVCGCLTQVARGMYPACTPELTSAISSDARIPHNELDIKPSDLPVFAEWQRRLDRELNRTPPAMIGGDE